MRPALFLALAMALLPGCAAGRALGTRGDDQGTGKLGRDRPNPSPKPGIIGPSAANAVFRG